MSSILTAGTRIYVGVTRKAREQIANLFYAGSNPVTDSSCEKTTTLKKLLTKDVVVLYYMHELRNQHVL